MTTDPILDAFARIVRRDASAPLVASLARAASRGDVDAWSLAAGAALAAAGARPGGYVLLSCVNGAGFLAALVGARRLGAVPVLADWTSPAAERLRVAHALGIPFGLSCDEAFPKSASSFRAEPLAEAGEPVAGAAYVKLTSGSTGAPSGVAVAAEALAADDDQLASSMGLVADDRFVAAIPWSHSYALSSLVMPALRRGSPLLLPEDGGPWAPLAAAASLGATVFPTVPVYLQTIAALTEPPAWPETLRTVISAGAPLRPETAERFRAAYGRDAHVFYGASESGGITYDRDGGAARRGTVGTPVDGVTIELPGADAGGEGTVAIRSAAAGIGYVPGGSDRLRGGVFRSADLARWTADGELELLGRADALINAGGKKVHPAEVEDVLRALPGVREAVVLGVVPPGSEREIVRAVVAGDRGVLSYTAVAAWCRDRLAAHKVPRSIVILDEIPRTSRGKIDRLALAGPEPAAARK